MSKKDVNILNVHAKLLNQQKWKNTVNTKSPQNKTFEFVASLVIFLGVTKHSIIRQLTGSFLLLKL